VTAAHALAIAHHDLLDAFGERASARAYLWLIGEHSLHEDVAAYAAPTVAPKPGKRPTPRTTIEAIMWCIRERGPQALHEPANIERLSRCDESAISEIDRRIAKLEATNAS
jgi:hypothetical protein